MLSLKALISTLSFTRDTGGWVDSTLASRSDREASRVRLAVTRCKIFLYLFSIFSILYYIILFSFSRNLVNKENNSQKITSAL